MVLVHVKLVSDSDLRQIESHLAAALDRLLDADGLTAMNAVIRAYVLAGERVQMRPVKVGHSSGLETEILEGLREGDEVILYPGDRVKEGNRVRPVKL